MGESPSSAPPALAGLTIEAVEWLPSGADSGLVRVRARWSSPEAARPGLPELVLRAGGGVEHRFESLPDARFARDAASWRGSYLVPVGLIAGEYETMWVEWAGGVRSGLPPLLPGLAAPPPAVTGPPPAAAEEVGEGGQLIDRAVLADRRARRAEAAEQAQARVAAEALRAVEALELQSAELERRLAETAAERDALASSSTAAPRETVALAQLRAETQEFRLRLRADEIARVDDAARLAVLADRGATARAAREALQRRARELEAERLRGERRAAELAAAERALEEAERRRRGEQAVYAEVRAALEERLEATAARLAAAEAARAELAAERGALEARAAGLEARVVELETALAEARAGAEVAGAAAATHEARLRIESAARTALEDELDRERAARAELVAELAAERAARAAPEDPTPLPPPAPEASLADAAREQAEAAAAATRTPGERSGRLVADLEAAAAALREAAAPAEPAAPPAAATPAESAPPVEPVASAAPAAPAEPAAPPAAGTPAEPASPSEPVAAAVPAAPAAQPVEPAAVPAAVVPAGRVRPLIVSAPRPPARSHAVGRSKRQYPPLRGAIVKLAHDDPVAAGRLIAALLPAQAAALAEPLDYDLTIKEVGTFAVTVAGTWTHVKRLPHPRPRGQSDFHLNADALTLAELLAGVDRRVGRFFGAARYSGRRRRLNALRRLPATTLSLAEAVRAGAALEPGLVYRALSYAVHPSWTRGERFTVAQQITGDPPETWYLTARDGAGLSVSAKPPEHVHDATVAMSRETFELLIRGEPVPRGARPQVRGDRRAVACLKAWTDRAQGA